MTEPTSPSAEPPDPSEKRSLFSDAGESGSAWTASGTDLPEDIELTPELVEEEAIRGDFMLRGAVILLAVLFGCGQISDSRTLVHIRSGADMRADGILPPTVDPYAAVSTGHRSANVSWLFDHLVSAAWAVGGPVGLTVFKAVLAGLMAWVLGRISVSGLPTWWNSVCVALAMAAAASDLMPITDLITLLGLSVMLRLLHRAHSGTVTGFVWKAPVLIAVWANLDSRAWIGILALLLYAAGRSLAAGDRSSDQVPVRTLWSAAGICVIALLIHPFPGASLLSVADTYLVEYPALRQLNPLNSSTVALLDGRTEYYSLFNAEIWNGFEFAYVAGLTIIVLALVVLAIARDRQELPWGLLLLGFTALAVTTVHELPAAALAAAVVAGPAGQRWYRRTFPQEYTTKRSEVLFSRAGRAATVFAFALVGFLIVTDRLPTRTPVGTGFTSDFATTLKALSQQFADLPEDAVALHTRPELGDFLIWSGRRSFIDSRITPFGSPHDESSAVSRYMRLRRDVVASATSVMQARMKSLREAVEKARAAAAGNEDSDESDVPQNIGDSAQPSEDSANTAAETVGDSVPDAGAVSDDDSGSADALSSAETSDTNGESEPGVNAEELQRRLQEAGVTHSIVRLAPPGAPDYRTMQVLSSDRRSWGLTDLGSSAAVFAYLPSTGPSEFTPFRAVEQAFRDVPEQELRRFEFAHEPGFYDRYLYRTRPHVPEDLRIAQHFLALPDSPAHAMIALRAAGRLLSRDSQNADGYYVLAVACSRLGAWESQVAARSGGRHAADMRYFQIVSAARQAVTVNPDHVGAWNLLYQVYMQRGRIDQALECLEELIRLEAFAEEDAAARQRDQLSERLQKVRTELEDGLERIDAAADQSSVVRRYSLVESAASSGDLTSALRLLSDIEADIREHAAQIFARAQTLKGQLLMEAGRLQEAFQLLAQLNAAAEQQDPAGRQIYPWVTTTFFSLICRGFYSDAATSMAETVSKLRRQRTASGAVAGFLTTLPLVAPIETAVVPDLPAALRWPMPQLAQARGIMQAQAQAQAEPQMMLALADLEAGNTEAARVGFQGVISECGATAWQPLASVYLTLLSEDADEFLAENRLDTWEDFPPELFDPRAETEDTETEDTETGTEPSDGPEEERVSDTSSAPESDAPADDSQPAGAD